MPTFLVVSYSRLAVHRHRTALMGEKTVASIHENAFGGACRHSGVYRAEECSCAAIASAGVASSEIAVARAVRAGFLNCAGEVIRFPIIPPRVSRP